MKTSCVSNFERGGWPCLRCRNYPAAKLRAQAACHSHLLANHKELPAVDATEVDKAENRAEFVADHLAGLNGELTRLPCESKNRPHVQ